VMTDSTSKLSIPKLWSTQNHTCEIEMKHKLSNIKDAKTGVSMAWFNVYGH